MSNFVLCQTLQAYVMEIHQKKTGPSHLAFQGHSKSLELTQIIGYV